MEYNCTTSQGEYLYSEYLLSGTHKDSVHLFTKHVFFGHSLPPYKVNMNYLSNMEKIYIHSTMDRYKATTTTTKEVENVEIVWELWMCMYWQCLVDSFKES